MHLSIEYTYTYIYIYMVFKQGMGSSSPYASEYRIYIYIYMVFKQGMGSSSPCIAEHPSAQRRTPWRRHSAQEPELASRREEAAK